MLVVKDDSEKLRITYINEWIRVKKKKKAVEKQQYLMYSLFSISCSFFLHKIIQILFRANIFLDEK